MLQNKFSILIPSRNGGAKLQRMLQSLGRQDVEIDEVILLDDGSDPPLPHPGGKIELLRHGQSRGCVITRNELAQRAKNEFMFFFDDDVILDDPSAIKKAAEIMASDSTIGAVAFQQRGVDGNLAGVQPVRGGQIRQIGTYFGWAYAIRRSAWERAGPFPEIFEYGWEEHELSLRLLQAGYKVMGDPSLSVIHDRVDNSKNLSRRHFLMMRNMFLTYLLYYPMARLPSWVKNGLLNVRPHPSVAESVWAFRLRLIGSLATKLPYLIRHRKPVSEDTLDTFWRLLKSAGTFN